MVQHFFVFFIFLGHMDASFIHRQLDTRALQCSHDVPAYNRIRRIIRGQISQPIAHRVAHVAFVVHVHQHAIGQRVLRHIGNVGLLDGFFDHSDHPGRRDIHAYVEPHPAPPLHRLPGAPPQHQKFALHQLAVGKHHGFPVARLDQRGTPAYIHHPAGNVVHLDPVADLDGVIHLQCQAAEDIAQRVLHRECHHGGNHRRGRDDAAQIQPGVAQPHQPPGDVADDDENVFCNARRRDAHPRQDDAEHHQPPQANRRDAGPDQSGFVEYRGGGGELQRVDQAADELQQQTGKEESQRVQDAFALFLQEMEQQERQPQRHRQHRQRLLAPEKLHCGIPERHAYSLCSGSGILHHRILGKRPGAPPE